MSPYLIAVDPGKNGALAWVCNGAPPSVAKIAINPLDVVDQIHLLPDLPAFKPGAVVCFFEEVSGYAGKAQPGSAMFRFGRQVGVVEGVLASMGVQVRKIGPQKWQKALSALSRPGEEKSAHKRRLRALALELYPFLSRQITLQTCDALLILHVGKEALK